MQEELAPKKKCKAKELRIELQRILISILKELILDPQTKREEKH